MENLAGSAALRRLPGASNAASASTSAAHSQLPLVDKPPTGDTAGCSLCSSPFCGNGTSICSPSAEVMATMATSPLNATIVGETPTYTVPALRRLHGAGSASRLPPSDPLLGTIYSSMAFRGFQEEAADAKARLMTMPIPRVGGSDAANGSGLAGANGSRTGAAEVGCSCAGLTLPSPDCTVCQAFTDGFNARHRESLKRSRDKRKKTGASTSDSTAGIKRKRERKREYSAETKKCLAYLQKKAAESARYIKRRKTDPVKRKTEPSIEILPHTALDAYNRRAYHNYDERGWHERKAQQELLQGKGAGPDGAEKEYPGFGARKEQESKYPGFGARVEASGPDDDEEEEVEKKQELEYPGFGARVEASSPVDEEKEVEKKQELEYPGFGARVEASSPVDDEEEEVETGASMHTGQPESEMVKDYHGFGPRGQHPPPPPAAGPSEIAANVCDIVDRVKINAAAARVAGNCGVCTRDFYIPGQRVTPVYRFKACMARNPKHDNHFIHIQCLRSQLRHCTDLHTLKCGQCQNTVCGL